MPGTLTVSGASQGLPSGSKTIGPSTITATNTIGAIDDASLSAGDNTFSIPTGAIAVAIISQNPPAAAVKIRTDLNPSDGGLPIAPTGANGWWAAFPIATGATELIINAAAAVSQIELTFI